MRGAIRIFLCLGAVTAALVSGGPGTARSGPAAVMPAFRGAARAFHVPVRLLLALGYVDTHWRMPSRPAADGGYGVMNLTRAQLARAARLTRIDPRAARHDLRQNVRAGAALLSALAPKRRAALSSWYEPLARLGGQPLADETFLVLRRGASATIRGERVRLEPARVATPRREAFASAAHADYPLAHWLAASTADYTKANRPRSNPITMIVVHVTDGSYAGTLSWFRNPFARATAHYVVRSSDGQITQMVREKDVAWHAGNSAVNATSVGIEHEGWTYHCSWFTDAMYRSSAQLVAYLVTKYRIPVDRKHIIGHNEVPDPNHPGQFGGAGHHTDPGPCWNWPKYMALVRTFAGASLATTLQRIVDDSTRRAFVAPRGWRRASAVGGYARGFVLSNPSPTGAAARFKLTVPRTGNYALYAWYPSARTRNSSVPVGIDTPSGRRWARVDERTGGGRWNYVGGYPLHVGKTTVRFSRATRATGSIAADAVKIELIGALPATALSAARRGWVLNGRGLSSTSDGGASWRSILPPGLAPAAVRGVRFLRTSGWLVAASGSGTAPLVLYRTSTGGATWTSTPLPAIRDVDLGAPVEIAPLDDLPAFLDLRLEPSRWSLSRAALLQTSDGGLTWTRSPLPAAGSIAFPSLLDGWLVGGFAHERLYATHDGGATWKLVTPPVPASGSIAYTPPTFSDPEAGVLPISVSAGKTSSLRFDTTADGGSTWLQATSVRLGSAVPFGTSLPTAIVSRDEWLAAVGGRLLRIEGEGTTRTSVGTLPGATSALKFVSIYDGWLEMPVPCARRVPPCAPRLFSTTDGGVTWTRLRPP
jgi:N-acetyl-anhydromuramyl-L-alanine amidase AmpD/photosystem II stability/assembly factor-like uncharacterized protein